MMLCQVFMAYIVLSVLGLGFGGNPNDGESEGKEN